ncbi:MerR family transcriptional regulator [Streptomyces sp. VRA16 Mangrove soil]|uniref:MerR family transcriptional regulator n=1 Tax=Streptomyces sp. VRA16 Mangrove soil TaxID=2817434 RepID=UPI001A9DC14D|nr:MerR family transcriptional regulator [Streptomyces sp. VRA16 Mangrove soil]MBO1335440.1 MerR family transcriptional regulator [Streptomyces sp. VRA16 Mangrove soil]
MTPFPIGELARRTGLTVKAIRFYSDTGIVTPAGRTPSGYRLYDTDAVARLALVRTLRELGIDLPTVRRVVVDRELSMAQVAAAHAEAIDVQIRTLRLRQSLLAAAARRGSTPEELNLMHRLTVLSEAERRRLTDDFLTAVFDIPEPHPAFPGIARSLTPELPADPTTEQLQAWAELAELLQDEAFRAAMRTLATDLAADLASPAARSLAEEVHRLVTPALTAGITPESPEARPIITALRARTVDPLPRLESMNDPRRARYLSLLAVVNGWPQPESPVPFLDWAVRALAATA